MSQLDVARFPWDPKPDPPAPAQPQQPQQPPAQQAVSQPPAPTHSQATFSPQLPQQPTPQQSHNGIKPDPDAVKTESIGNVPIKQETPGHIAMPPPKSFNGMEGNSVAANRAAQLVQQQYGDRVPASTIDAIRHGNPTPGPQQPQQGQPQGQQDPQALYRQQMMAAAQQQQQQGANGQSNLHNAQTDGGFDTDSDEDEDEDDFEAVLMRKTNGNLEELGRVDIDRLIHDRIASQAKAMEGGGLMVPLKEATRHKTARNPNRKGKGVAQNDGGDDEEYDEDAINSDLDDPEEGGSDDEVDDEGLGHIMLCMYDKVQRVKNKW